MKKIVTLLALLALLTSCGTKTEPENLQDENMEVIDIVIDDNNDVVILENGNDNDVLEDIDTFLESVISEIENANVENGSDE